MSVPPSERPKPIPPGRLLSVLKAQGFRCPYTGRKLTPQTAESVYHVPLSKGGLGTAENVRIVHREAAEARGGLTWEEFVALCRDVARQAK